MTKYKVLVGMHVIDGKIVKAGNTFDVESDTLAQGPDGSRLFERIPSKEEAVKLVAGTVVEKQETADTASKDEPPASTIVEPVVKKRRGRKVAAQAELPAADTNGSDTTE